MQAKAADEDFFRVFPPKDKFLPEVELKIVTLVV
jgi:hypothetical protein